MGLQSAEQLGTLNRQGDSDHFLVHLQEKVVVVPCRAYAGQVCMCSFFVGKASQHHKPSLGHDEREHCSICLAAR